MVPCNHMAQHGQLGEKRVHSFFFDTTDVFIEDNKLPMDDSSTTDNSMCELERLPLIGRLPLDIKVEIERRKNVKGAESITGRTIYAGSFHTCSLLANWS